MSVISDTSELVSDLVDLSATARFQAIRSLPMSFNERKTIRLMYFIIIHFCSISHNAKFYLNLNLNSPQQEQSELRQALKDHAPCRLSSTGVPGKKINTLFRFTFVIIMVHIPCAAWYFKTNNLPLQSFRRFRANLASARQRLVIWQGTLKEIGGRFGTSVLSYFLFLKWLLKFNLLSLLINFCFITIPQIAHAPNISTATGFRGLELLTGVVSFYIESKLYIH